ncbi:flagellar biosynthesis protein FlhF [Paramaledivibacter caminithermalis]|uniref:Flagellar biosynthesis protein FlhF n=1 Tax=Paramaledivibacter caminithermalis (strain DSM 15212 / CIP 107654 / DViRD3) TaxID=1121301 RepID=A0A1M6N6Z9_PARC5|nr:flagellar biosynthesis protein FlhF [Paramaledivibacter caminithermalis]SHJ91384.1 flagellar biosynthesis protein FlhF [Paramaledivibacter caminithermalis DSM 15212]
MKVKRYITKDVQEAMIKIKSELGRDAIILHTRKIKERGLKGFLKKPLVEVVAAVDSIEQNNAQPKYFVNSSPVKQNIIEKNKSSNVSSYDINNINKEIDSIKMMLSTVIDNMNKNSNTNNDGVLQKYEKCLMDKGVIKPVSDKILSIVRRQISISNENDSSIRNALKIILKDYLGNPYIISNNSRKQNVIIFVGPTGVGKTTTLAKLAAKQTIMNKRSVAFITADTYRIAAVDQLKTYSEILDVPLTVIYEPNEVKDAIEKYSDKDYIFIDTAGRNHRNKELLKEVTSILEYVESPEIFLLLSLTTSYKNIEDIIKSYQFLDDYSLIFTKADETSCFGNILNAKFITSKPISYLTTGQSVPDDIEIADIDKIVNMFVGD